MASNQIWKTALGIGALLAGAVAGPLTPTATAEPTDSPSLRLMAATRSVSAVRNDKHVVAVVPPLYVATQGGSLDLRVSRPDYASPVTVTQVVHAADGTTTRVPLPEARADDLTGLKGFYRVTVTNSAGTVVRTSLAPWCPNSYQPQRLDPDGTGEATFPEGCFAIPFSLGSAWGIDDGWAAPALGDWRAYRFKAARTGTFHMTLTVRPAYARMFGIAAADATATLTVRVRDAATDRPARSARTATALPRNPQVPTLAAPPTGQLPDLRSLPAFGIGVVRHDKRDYLAFASNVWVGGTSRLDIEGFRRPGTNLMDAYQYFYDGDQVVGRAPAGELEFDTRTGHHHWHLSQFARYRLLKADRTHLVRSTKQSFCIAPTDPVDLSLDEAERRPYQTGLDSACGDGSALWIRETLPVGWGDTYFQFSAGQSFNITSVPNGTYYIAVEANPTGDLFETDPTNNVALRKVVLKGRPGKRGLCVPAVHGIDEEGSCG